MSKAHYYLLVFIFPIILGILFLVYKAIVDNASISSFITGICEDIKTYKNSSSLNKYDLAEIWLNIPSLKKLIEKEKSVFKKLIVFLHFLYYGLVIFFICLVSYIIKPFFICYGIYLFFFRFIISIPQSYKTSSGVFEFFYNHAHVYVVDFYFVFSTFLWVLISILLLCFDKDHWVKNFESYYGPNIVKILGFNNPYESAYTKAFFALGISSLFGGFSGDTASCQPPENEGSASAKIPAEPRSQQYTEGSFRVSAAVSNYSAEVEIKGAQSTLTTGTTFSSATPTPEEARIQCHRDIKIPPAEISPTSAERSVFAQRNSCDQKYQFLKDIFIQAGKK
jgi:hypothetical protein